MSKSKMLGNAISKKRIWELDFLRGICVLLMVWDHLMYDIAFIFGKKWAATGSAFLENIFNGANAYWISEIRTFFHPIIFITFFVICGISCSFSKSNLKRGIEALILAFLITIVTTVLDTVIRFGVLHMLGFAILIWWIIDTLCGNKKYLTAGVCLGVGILILLLNQYFTLHPPESNNDLGFIGQFFVQGYYDSADYFPIFPNVGYMLIGASIGPLLYRKKQSLLPMLDRFGWHQPISIWGRVALWIYVLHQVVIAVLLSLISYLFITPGDFIFF